MCRDCFCSTVLRFVYGSLLVFFTNTESVYSALDIIYCVKLNIIIKRNWVRHKAHQMRNISLQVALAIKPTTKRQMTIAEGAVLKMPHISRFSEGCFLLI